MGRTIAEKILSRAGNAPNAVVGDIVNGKVDIAMAHENAAAIGKHFETLGLDAVWDNNKIVIPIDHCVPAANEKYAAGHKAVREFAKKYNITHFYDIKEGVCHQVLPEKGHVLPGSLMVGSDSHTCTYGAFGAFATGIGRTEMAAVFATGELWLQIPETIKMNVTGKLPDKVTSKDIILHIIGSIGADGADYKSTEFVGDTIDNMSISSRMTMCNMAIEMGGKAGICKYDSKTEAYLKSRTNAQFTPVYADDDAEYCDIMNFDVTKLDPQVACPHTVDNVKPVGDVAGTPINEAVLGTCTNGRLEDFEAAVRILKGKKIPLNVRLLVFPASQEQYMKAIEAGYITELIKSGAVVCNPNCGPCLGAHEGVLAPGEKAISTANRNFKGRMGCKEAEVYLGSPATVAASALTGEITDPREVDA